MKIPRYCTTGINCQWCHWHTKQAGIHFKIVFQRHIFRISAGAPIILMKRFLRIYSAAQSTFQGCTLIQPQPLHSKSFITSIILPFDTICKILTPSENRSQKKKSNATNTLYRKIPSTCCLCHQITVSEMSTHLIISVYLHVGNYQFCI
jgi:hypothetical protein